MTRIRPIVALFLCALGAAAAPTVPSPSAVEETGRYPRDITPPAGTQYPCALTALPKDLPGIPPADRNYINRTYARVLRATQAKLLLLKALSSGKESAAAFRAYESSVTTLLRGLKEDRPPRGLERFHRDVLEAIELQHRFFAKAVPLRASGTPMDRLFAMPEAHEASRRLIAAWGAMSARYPAWPKETRDSIYHHLCALDFF